MGYKIVVNADMVTDYQFQSARRVKIEKNVAQAFGWNEGDRIIELADYNKEIVILIKKEKFEKLLKDKVIEII